MNRELHAMPWYLWLPIAVILLMQGGWLFYDARKNTKYPWFWGIWGMTGFPTPIVIYLIFIRKIWKRKRENRDG